MIFSYYIYTLNLGMRIIEQLKFAVPLVTALAGAGCLSPSEEKFQGTLNGVRIDCTAIVNGSNKETIHRAGKGAWRAQSPQGECECSENNNFTQCKSNRNGTKNYVSIGKNDMYFSWQKANEAGEYTHIPDSTSESQATIYHLFRSGLSKIISNEPPGAFSCRPAKKKQEICLEPSSSGEVPSCATSTQ